MRRQIEYGRQRGVPWGISESAYAFTDRAGNYQYRAFGVPGLGLKRGLSDDLVGRSVRHRAGEPDRSGCRGAELRRLARGAWTAGSGSTRRSITDRTAGQRRRSSRRHPRPVVVRAFFAHHQGMSLVALANVICDDAFVKRFHADPRVQATELLLQERVPREAILSEPRPAESTTATPSLPVFASRRFRSPHTASPHTQFLSNGRYTRAVTHAGGGSSTVAATWRSHGCVTIERRIRGAIASTCATPWSGQVWSATYQPCCQEPDEYEAIFDLDKVTFRRRDGDFETQLEVTVSSEDDVEVRRLSITNRGDRPREVEVTSYAEIVLARPEDDFAHPAFGKLFIETEYDPQSAGLLFSRRPRAPARPSGRSTCSAWRDAWAARSNGRRIERDSSAAGDRPPTRWRSTAAHCPARSVRCSIRSRRCASACVSRQARSSE